MNCASWITFVIKICCVVRDLELALASLSYISSPLGVGEVEVLKQRATDIQRSILFVKF